MGNLVHLHGDAHEQTLKLLPWYLNGTLDEAEAAMVEAHLIECPACDSEAKSERGLRDGVTTLGLDTDHGWATMRQKLEGADARPAPRPAIWRRRIGLGWTAGGALAASVATAAILTLQPAAPDNLYRTLGTAPATAPAASAANAIILFAPDISAKEMRELLTDAEARITDGPLASGGFMLRLASEARDQRLAQLRAQPGVVMAEPLDTPASR